MGEPALIHKALQMGLGEALERLIHLNSLRVNGIANEEQRRERQLIIDALNQTKLDLGFDCDLDGVPDDVRIFAQTASTSCCRIVPNQPKTRRTSKPRATRKTRTTRAPRRKK